MRIPVLRNDTQVQLELTRNQLPTTTFALSCTSHVRVVWTPAISVPQFLSLAPASLSFCFFWSGVFLFLGTSYVCCLLPSVRRQACHCSERVRHPRVARVCAQSGHLALLVMISFFFAFACSSVSLLHLLPSYHSYYRVVFCLILFSVRRQARHRTERVRHARVARVCAQPGHVVAVLLVVGERLHQQQVGRRPEDRIPGR